MKKIKRSDALSMLSIMYAYSENTSVKDLCFLALQKERILASNLDNRHARKKVLSFFKNIPKDFSDGFSEDDSGKLTIMNFILFISRYLSNFRSEKVFYLKDISDETEGEIKDFKDIGDSGVDKSEILINLLGISK